MAKYICTTEIEIEAEDEDDARIELLIKMDDHELSWEVELIEDKDNDNN